jgi:hypothetical protein
MDTLHEITLNNQKNTENIIDIQNKLSDNKSNKLDLISNIEKNITAKKKINDKFLSSIKLYNKIIDNLN